MALKLPRISAAGIGDPREFSRHWDEFATAIERTVNRIATVEDDIVTINDGLDDVTAEGLFRVTQGTTEVGAEATIELSVRSDTDDTFHPASIKISSKAGAESEIDITADTIKLTADRVEIDGTVLSNGGVITQHLAVGAATDADSVAFSALASVADTTWRDCGSVTRVWSGGKAQFDFSVSIDNNDAGDHKINFRVRKDGAVQKNYPNVAGRGYVCPGSNELSVTIPYDNTPTAASHTYAFQYACVTGDETSNLTLDGALRWSDIKR